MKRSILLALLISGQALASTTTSNMGLLVPSAQDTDYPTSISTSFSLIDAHDHSSGKGVGLGLNSVPTSAIQASAITATKLATDSVTTAKIVDANVTTSKLADGSVTQAKREALSYQLSSASGSFTTSSTTFTDVTNLTVTISTTGRPVVLMAVPDGSATSSLGLQSSASGFQSFTFGWVRDGSTIQTLTNRVEIGSGSIYAPGLVNSFDVPAAGSHNYKLQARVASGANTLAVTGVKIVAFEL